MESAEEIEEYPEDMFPCKSFYYNDKEDAV